MPKRTRRAALAYLKGRIKPEDLLHFIELKPFTRRWDALQLPDEVLGDLQLNIMAGPTKPPVIQGTNGLRKMRYSPASWPSGKSSALRVCYVYFEQFHTVILVLAYRKNEMDTIPESAKSKINTAIDQIEKELRRIA